MIQMANIEVFVQDYNSLVVKTIYSNDCLHCLNGSYHGYLFFIS